MEIGNDEFDEFGELQDQEVNNQEEKQETTTQDTQQNQDEETDFITELLKTKGIQDSSKINFENEDGEIEERDWNTLSNEEKLNILNSQDDSASNDLDDSEIQLLNAIRESKMTPSEYISYVQNQGIQNYIQNYQVPVQQYTVDDLNDDELFVSDLITKFGDDNLSDEQIQKLLDNAKSDEELYKRQITALRNEYRRLEDNNRQQEQLVQQNQQTEVYNNFAEKVEDEIRAFTDLNGYDLNMDESEMEELYDFITGFDAAGTSTFSKALNDPRTLVKMAWFALNGESAIDDINNYWTNEIKNVRKTSYEKGVNDAKNGKVKKNSVQIKNNKNNRSSNYDDLDDF